MTAGAATTDEAPADRPAPPQNGEKNGNDENVEESDGKALSSDLTTDQRREVYDKAARLVLLERKEGRKMELLTAAYQVALQGNFRIPEADRLAVKQGVKRRVSVLKSAEDGLVPAD
eukprot:scaffold567251_cov39-Prasinocladus_malaysianus.AAC.1